MEAVNWLNTVTKVSSFDLTILKSMSKHTAFALSCLLAMTLAPLYVAAADTTRLTGSGASFPYPIYSTWFKTYTRQKKNVIVDYQAKGSGAGIRDFINNTVDFAGSDAAMTDAEIDEVSGGVVMLPVTAGAIVIAYNLPGVDAPLRLSRYAYTGIFLGDISQWNDDAIAASNPGISLPDMPITVVRRADSSGTTFAFSNHLAAVSADWRDGPGIGKTVLWPSSDRFVAAPKNDGVTATIMQTPGAIGYIEYGYARFAKVKTAELENAAGRYVTADLESGREALASAEVPDDMRIWLPDPAGDSSYPIVTYSWLLLKRNNEDAAKAKALREIVEYCLTEGQAVADRMGYLPIPDSVVAKVRASLTAVQ